MEKESIQIFDEKQYLPIENRSFYQGPFSPNNRTHNGYRLDVCKSCIQKYVRRGELSKAFYFTCQLYLFKEVQKRVFSNLLNRLRCIISEDIGIADDTGVLIFSQILENQPDLFKLYQLLNLMCSSKKTRLISHINTFYQKRGLSYRKKCYDPSFFKKIFPIGTFLQSQSSLKDFLQIFNCFSFEQSGKRSPKQILKFLKNQTLSPVQTLLINRYKASSLKEKFVFLFHAILLFFKPPPQKEADFQFQQQTFIQILEKVKSGQKQEVEDFCLDKHTRGSTKTTKDFALQGSLVTNQDMSLRIPQFYQTYISVRVGNSLPSFLFQAQLLTSKNKHRVFVYQDIVIKGPYQENSKSFINNIKATQQLKALQDQQNLPPEMKSCLLIQEILDKPQGKYFVWPNIGNTHKAVTQNLNSKLETGVLVAKRGSFVKRVSEIVKNKTVSEIQEDDLLKKIVLASLQHLFNRAKLGILDNCLQNVLVVERSGDLPNGQLVVGIDLEERSPTAPTSPFKKSTRLSKLLVKSFESYLITQYR